MTDNYRWRLGAAALGALGWMSALGVLLAAFGHVPSLHPVKADVVPVQIVDMPPPPVPQPDTVASQAPRSSPTSASAKPVSPNPTPATTSRAAQARPTTDNTVQTHAKAADAPAHRAAPVDTAVPSAHPEPSVPATPPQPAPTAQAKTTTPAPVADSVPQSAPQASSPSDAASRASSADARANAASGSETAGADHHAAGSAAHAIYQPLPEVPDEAREEAFTAVALARFTVHADGHCDVSLVEPTRNPTLNRLLLTSLRQWRFAPATEGGHAVETTIDLRVHFNVQ